MVRGVRAVEREAAQRVERTHGRFLRRFGRGRRVDQSAIARSQRRRVDGSPRQATNAARRVEKDT